VFDPRSGHLVGTLSGANGRPIVIDGLWGPLVGDAVAGGPGAVWFSARAGAAARPRPAGHADRELT
jgi:hypothetical protein